MPTPLTKLDRTVLRYLKVLCTSVVGITGIEMGVVHITKTSSSGKGNGRGYIRRKKNVGQESFQCLLVEYLNVIRESFKQKYIYYYF